MGTLYNIYCDESCHLPNDNSNVMVLGAITCPANMKKKVYEDLRTIKKKHEVNPVVEVKWTKLGKAKIDLS
ncbi:DUF3800 domain-containing protein [Caloramator australicus]|nr:DUF3800 domain-containing protein [Caloramator australicus]